MTGAVDWTDTANRQVSGVSQVMINPAFEVSGPQHDAALLVLSAPFTTRQLVSGGPGRFPGGTGAVIAGWGLSNASDSGIDTSQLGWAQTVIQSVTYCSQPFSPSYPYDSASDLCAINPPTYDTNTCHGDSGGPLLAQDSSGDWIEVGLTSVGPADCDTQEPSYFTSLEPIAPWIEQEIAAVSSTPPSTGSTGGAGAPTSGASAGGSGSSPTNSGTTSATGEMVLMSIQDAHYYVNQVASHVRGAINIHVFSRKCSRTSSIRVTCTVDFWSGPNDYYAHVTVYYVSGPDAKTQWTDHYSVEWVNDHCYWHTNHRRTCAVHSRTGTY